MKQRSQFISIECYAQTAVNKKFNMFDIAGEITRAAKNSGHVSNPTEPVCVFGYGVGQIDEYVHTLAKIANAKTETYSRRGKGHENATEHVRAVSKARPILISAIASYPEPSINDSEDRRRWIELVVIAFRLRFGKRFRSAILHTDEAFPHLHLLCDSVGASVKGPGGHPGHEAAAAEPDIKERGVAYRAGCVAFQDWYQEHVGAHMGWLRSSPKPRTRTSRSIAMRERQREQEEIAEAQAKMLAKIKAGALQLLSAQQQVNAQRAEFAQLKKDLREEVELVCRMKAAIKDQSALEERLQREDSCGAEYWD
ncbi:MAG: hypothetical protein H7252_02405 [Cytophaga sp.]|nr:hypothetical protein [Undibacterium sp.]